MRTPQPDLEKADSATKLTYFREKFYQSPNFPNDILSIYPSTSPSSESQRVTKIKTETAKNEPLATVFTSMVVKWTPLETFEGFTGGAAVKGAAFDGTTQTLGGIDPVSVPTCWVTATDWKDIMYVVFSISKIIMNLAIIYVCVVKPFLPEWTKLRAIWIGQTVIYYQLLVYSGLLPGVFGYTIDMG